MRHRVYGKHLGRDKNQRTALFRGLVRSLFLQGTIKTTEAKAKAIKGLVDKLIVKGKQNTNASHAVIESFLPQKEVSDKLIKEIAPGYTKRSSGFTQMVRMGRRLGDGAEIVRISLIKADEIKKASTSAPPSPKLLRRPSKATVDKQKSGKEPNEKKEKAETAAA